MHWRRQQSQRGALKDAIEQKTRKKLARACYRLLVVCLTIILCLYNSCNSLREWELCSQGTHLKECIANLTIAYMIK